MDADKIYIPIITHITKKIIDVIFNKSEYEISNNNISKDKEDEIQQGLGRHLNKVLKWSDVIQFFTMTSPMDVDNNTLPLSFSSTPRKFRGDKNISDVLEEDDILNNQDNYVLLGGPGAGKTTTLKRLIRKILLNEPVSDLDIYQAPLLIRLRELNNSYEDLHPLLTNIAKEIGLDYEIKTIKEIAIINGKEEEIHRHIKYCEGIPIEEFIPELLSNLKFIVFLDGLDELSSNFRNSVENDIDHINSRTSQCKIILTCRSGEYKRHHDYMTVVELCDLSDDEVEKITEKWLNKNKEDKKDFIEKVRSLPYKDLTHRPLFLTQLIVLYDNSGDLPKQPYEIYRLITLLSIKEWDEQRRVQRKSAYATFQPERKLEFLSHLSFELTSNKRSQQFTHGDLISIYKKIRRKFELPDSEERLVAQEIESHTGIVVEVGYGQYEFSHLTIQEYLCAYYISRSPFPDRIISSYVQRYPAPLAIATTLSSEPDVWLSNILLNPNIVRSAPADELEIFLKRLTVENPNFVESDILGLCFISLLFRVCEINNNSEKEMTRIYIDKMLCIQEINNSIVDILSNYNVVVDSDNLAYKFNLQRNIWEDDLYMVDAIYSIQAPIEGKVERRWIDEISTRNNLFFNGYNFIRRL